MKYSQSQYRPFDNVIPTKIDLREELRSFYEDDKVAHWIILRHFDKTKPSVHWNEMTQEAVGGPAWEYTDVLILARKSAAGRAFGPHGSQERFTARGLMDDTGYRFYLEHDTSPDIEDVIYETSYQGTSRPDYIPLNQYESKWNITSVIPMNDQQYGRIEYFVCFVEKDGK